MNRAALLALAVLFCVCGGAVALATAGLATPPVEQPIAFNHLRHAKRDIACADCHQGVETSAFACLPRVSLCMDCHGEDTDTTPEKDRMKAYAAAKTEIPWVRLYRLPAHVVFSHERHVALGKVRCDACHGSHGESERPPERPVSATLRMRRCLSCHAEKGASVDCVACHK